jgi:hypothetical protein
MEFKRYWHIIYISLISALLLSHIFLLNKSIIINFEYKQEKYPIDYQIKDINDCYLTVHNFVSVNSTIEQTQSTIISKDVKNKFNFKTYIYSYTKPYLLELIQNSTKDCLCCPI